MAERTIYLSAFPYTDGNGVGRWAQRGETVDLGEADVERGERLGAFESLEAPVIPADAETGEVPAGTITEVLAWVGDDQERALAALTVEEAATDPRSTLVAKLNDLLAD